MNLIYHIVSATDWAKQESQSSYEAASLQTEGSIHLSTEKQVAGTLNRYYQHVPDLLLLHVDPDKLTSDLRYELATNQELFPICMGLLIKRPSYR